jgi:hypothetical protein
MVRMVKTVKPGVYTVVTTGLNHKKLTKVKGRVQGIRTLQHSGSKNR